MGSNTVWWIVSASTTGATSGKPWSRLHGLTEWNWCKDANQTLFDGLNRSPPVGQKALVARDLVTITTLYVHFIIIEMQMLVHTYHGVRCTCLSALDIQSTYDWVQLYMKSTHNDTSECKAHSDFIEGASNTQWITSTITVCSTLLYIFVHAQSIVMHLYASSPYAHIGCARWSSKSMHNQPHHPIQDPW